MEIKKRRREVENLRDSLKNPPDNPYITKTEFNIYMTNMTFI